MPVDYWVDVPKNNFEKIKQNLTVDSLTELIVSSERVLDKACNKFSLCSTKEAVKKYFESEDIKE